MITDTAPDDDDAEEAPTRRTRRRGKRTEHASLGHLIADPVVKAGLVVIGTVGLAAMVAALVGPKRMNRQVYTPLRDTIEPQIDRIAAQAGTLQDQITQLFEKTAPESRKRLARNIQSWISNFHTD